MRNFKRIISILIIAIMLIGIISVMSPVKALTMSQMNDKINNFKEKGDVTVDVTSIAGEFTGLAKILTTIGAGVLVIVITYMGIKYFIASPEEQAKLKGQLIGIVVSGLVIFGATAIWKMAIEIFRNM